MICSVHGAITRAEAGPVFALAQLVLVTLRYPASVGGMLQRCGRVERPDAGRTSGTCKLALWTLSLISVAAVSSRDQLERLRNTCCAVGRIRRGS